VAAIHPEDNPPDHPVRHARYQAELPGGELCQHTGNCQSLITIDCAYRCTRDYSWLQGAAEVLEQSCLRENMLGLLRHHGRVDLRGTHHGDAHAGAVQFLAQGIGHADHRKLRGGVRTVATGRDDAAERGNETQLSAPLCEHRRQQGACHLSCTHKVDPDDALEILILLLHETPACYDACGENHDVGYGEMRQERVDLLLHYGSIR